MTAAALTAAAVIASACAHAEPQPPPPGPSETSAPTADASCTQSGALATNGEAITGNNLHLLQCTNGTWQQFDDPYPSSDLWLTTGPELMLHGQGRRNPEVKAGPWTATPQTTEAKCGAEVVDVLGAGETSEPRMFSADAGQPLSFEISDHLFTVKLSGYCLWQRG